MWHRHSVASPTSILGLRLHNTIRTDVLTFGDASLQWYNSLCLCCLVRRLVHEAKAKDALHNTNANAFVHENHASPWRFALANSGAKE